MEPTPQQLTLPMLTWYDGPQLVPAEVVKSAPTYREAVRACWNLRRRRTMTRRALAEEAGMLPSHLTDYLSEHPDRRDMPAKYVKRMQIACGNLFITQWLAQDANVTILEQFIEQRRAA